MNQPASKEPTMDEILSSIRQIIADDDEAAARKAPPSPAPRAVAAAVPLASVPEPVPAPAAAFDPFVDPFEDDEDDAVPTLALTEEQIVRDEPAAEELAPFAAPHPAPAASASQPERPSFQPAPVPYADIADDEDEDDSAPVAFASPGRVDPDDVTFATSAEAPEEPAARPRPSFAQSAPLPDPTLTSDLADQLLEPAAAAAVGSAFSRLNAPRLTPGTPVGVGGLTIEAMLRDMLRPMLKDWLDENLPAMVERLVEQEIERASRGR